MCNKQADLIDRLTHRHIHVSPSCTQFAENETHFQLHYFKLSKGKISEKKKKNIWEETARKHQRKVEDAGMPRCYTVTAVLFCHPEILCTEQQPDRHRAKSVARDQCHTKAFQPDTSLCRHSGSIPRFPSYQQILLV